MPRSDEYAMALQESARGCRDAPRREVKGTKVTQKRLEGENNTLSDPTARRASAACDGDVGVHEFTRPFFPFFFLKWELAPDSPHSPKGNCWPLVVSPSAVSVRNGRGWLAQPPPWPAVERNACSASIAVPPAPDARGTKRGGGFLRTRVSMRSSAGGHGGGAVTGAGGRNNASTRGGRRGWEGVASIDDVYASDTPTTSDTPTSC